MSNGIQTNKYDCDGPNYDIGGDAEEPQMLASANAQEQFDPAQFCWTGEEFAG